MIKKELLKILVCPVCKGEVSCADNKIVCSACSRRYPIVDGIPVMLAEEAELEKTGEAIDHGK